MQLKTTEPFLHTGSLFIFIESISVSCHKICEFNQFTLIKCRHFSSEALRSISPATAASMSGRPYLLAKRINPDCIKKAATPWINMSQSATHDGSTVSTLTPYRIHSSSVLICTYTAVGSYCFHNTAFKRSTLVF